LEPSRFICVARSVVSSAVAAMRSSSRRCPAAKESAIRLLELDVRGEKRGEIRESSTASEENGR